MIVKNGRRICGTGGALCNVPITQNKAYFEVKIQALGNNSIHLKKFLYFKALKWFLLIRSMGCWTWFKKS